MSLTHFWTELLYDQPAPRNNPVGSLKNITRAGNPSGCLEPGTTLTSCRLGYAVVITENEYQVYNVRPLFPTLKSTVTERKYSGMCNWSLFAVILCSDTSTGEENVFHCVVVTLDNCEEGSFNSFPKKMTVVNLFVANTIHFWSWNGGDMNKFQLWLSWMCCLSKTRKIIARQWIIKRSFYLKKRNMWVLIKLLRVRFCDSWWSTFRSLQLCAMQMKYPTCRNIYWKIHLSPPFPPRWLSSFFHRS